MHRFLSFFAAALLFLILPRLPVAAQSYHLEKGTIEGAKYVVAVPEKPNGHVLIYAHGYVPDHFPLIAPLYPEHKAFKALLDEGWTVAATSYRRNGLLVNEGPEDVEKLWRHVAKKYGAPGFTLFYGESMGGMVVTLIAERNPLGLAPGTWGAVATDGAVTLLEKKPITAPGYEFILKQLPADKPAWTHAPLCPMIFLTNQSELDGPTFYVQAAHGSPLPPVLWRISRDGHVNVTQEEIGSAWTAVIQAAGNASLLSDRDATHPAEPVPSVAEFKKGAAVSTIREADPVYGNMIVNFQPADFDRLGIKPRSTFTITANGITGQVFYGTSFGDVPIGKWVVFPTADGWMCLSKNFENGAEALHAKAGDAITAQAMP